jgi:hypothetical protein
VPAGSDLAPGPTTGTLAVASEARSTQPVGIEVPSTTAPGDHAVTFSLETSTGTVLPDVVAEVDVT